MQKQQLPVEMKCIHFKADCPPSVFILSERLEIANSNEKFKLLLGRDSEKAMAPHSSTLAWKIPWMEEPGRLQSMGLLRV